LKLKVALVNFNKKSLQSKKRRALNEIANFGVKTIKSEITKRRLIKTGTLKQSVGADVTKNRVNFDIGADYAGIINDGVKRHKMRYLVDQGPIPIKVGGRKKIIFRVANKRNIKLRGKWIHPGFKRGKGFVDVSAEKIADKSAEIIAKVGLV